MNFEGRICVITGGANGIGRCLTEEFLACGATVAIVDVDSEQGEKMQLQYGSDRFFFFSGDIAEEPVLNAFARAVLNRFSKIDYLINNACISRRGILSGCSYDDFNYVLRLGVTAPYQLASLFLKAFRPGASIVNIASTRAVMSQADTESYSAAKGGIRALTHALSVSLSGRVRVNSVSPGWIETGAYQKEAANQPVHSREDQLQHPAGRVGVPADIAKMVLFLCSDDAGFITGENITIDGGMTHQMIYHGDAGWTYQAGDSSGL